MHKAKSTYIQDNLQRNRENQKTFWHLLRTVFNGGNSQTVEMEFINPETNQKISREDTPNFLNEFFINIGTDTNQPDINLFEGPIKNNIIFEETTV